MEEHEELQRATEPEELSQFFLERANAGDVNGVAELYEPDAVLAGPDQVSTGIQAIRRRYEELLAGNPTFTGEIQAALRAGDLALTSVKWSMSAAGPAGQPRTFSGTSGEVARRQPDGAWLWVIDQPSVLA